MSKRTVSTGSKLYLVTVSSEDFQMYRKIADQDEEQGETSMWVSKEPQNDFPLSSIVVVQEEGTTRRECFYSHGFIDRGVTPRVTSEVEVSLAAFVYMEPPIVPPCLAKVENVGKFLTSALSEDILNVGGIAVKGRRDPAGLGNYVLTCSDVADCQENLTCLISLQGSHPSRNEELYVEIEMSLGTMAQMNQDLLYWVRDFKPESRLPQTLRYPSANGQSVLEFYHYPGETQSNIFHAVAIHGDDTTVLKIPELRWPSICAEINTYVGVYGCQGITNSVMPPIHHVEIKPRIWDLLQEQGDKVRLGLPASQAPYIPGSIVCLRTEGSKVAQGFRVSPSLPKMFSISTETVEVSLERLSESNKVVLAEHLASPLRIQQFDVES